METKYQTRFIFSLCIGTVFLILALGWLLLTAGPRVRFVQGLDELTSQSLHRNSSITIRFDRPIEERDYTESVTISPAVEHETRTLTQGVRITFLENLDSNQEYTIAVAPDIRDATGRQMKDEYREKFTIDAPRLIYIERDFEIDETNSRSDGSAPDRLVQKSIGGEEEVLFEADRIASFAANDEYVTVALFGTDGRDRLVTINLRTGTEREESLLLPGRILNLSMSQQGKIAFFTVLPDPNSVTDIVLEKFSNRVEALNLETGEIRSLAGATSDPVIAFSIMFDSLGQTALLQDGNGTFNAYSPFEDFDPVLIGNRDDSFGFQPGGNSIYFRSNAALERYDTIDASTTLIPDEDIPGFTRVLVPTEDYLLLLSQTGTSSDSLQTLYAIQYDDVSQNEILWTTEADERVFVSDVIPSFDSNIIAVEANENTCQFDRVTTNSQCQDATTRIIDLQSGEEIDRFLGFDSVWLP